MRNILKNFLAILSGLIILIGFYFISSYITKLLHLALPPAILGLILFAVSLISGIIKENWVKPACDFLLNNMAMFFVPLFCGLIAYKALLLKNWLAIFIVLFITTSLVIILTGLFVEWGMKYTRLHKIFTRKNHE